MEKRPDKRRFFLMGAILLVVAILLADGLTAILRTMAG